MNAQFKRTAIAQRLYVLDYGLFEVHDNGRVIGIQGYLIQADNKNILVDTGFPAWYADDPLQAGAADDLGLFGHLLHLDEGNLPPAQLARAGLTPADIDILVLTHGDIDHVGGIADFPQATLVVGRAEKALPQPRYFNDRSPISWPDAVTYQLIDGDFDLCPGVVLLASPGHSPGHLSLLVNLPQTGPILLTVDAISRPAEFEAGFGGAWDEAVARQSAERLMAIAEDVGATIIYGHDPDQWPTLHKAPKFYE